MHTIPATTYLKQKDTNRVSNYDTEKTYRIPIETGTGHFTTALARFGEDGWEYLHLDYDKWFPVPDDVEILEWDYPSKRIQALQELDTYVSRVKERLGI